VSLQRTNCVSIVQEQFQWSKINSKHTNIFSSDIQAQISAARPRTAIYSVKNEPLKTIGCLKWVSVIIYVLSLYKYKENIIKSIINEKQKSEINRQFWSVAIMQAWQIDWFYFLLFLFGQNSYLVNVNYCYVIISTIRYWSLIVSLHLNIKVPKWGFLSLWITIFGCPKNLKWAVLKIK